MRLHRPRVAGGDPVRAARITIAGVMIGFVLLAGAGLGLVTLVRYYHAARVADDQRIVCAFVNLAPRGTSPKVDALAAQYKCPPYVADSLPAAAPDAAPSASSQEAATPAPSSPTSHSTAPAVHPTPVAPTRSPTNTTRLASTPDASPSDRPDASAVATPDASPTSVLCQLLGAVGLCPSGGLAP